jgi:hypothetical protein
VYELCAGQLATGQVWSQRAFTVVAMTFPALDVLGLQPKNLPPLGITSGRRRRLLRERLLKERKQKQNHEKGTYRHGGRTFLAPIGLPKRGYVTSDLDVGKVGDDRGGQRRSQLATPFMRGVLCPLLRAIMVSVMSYIMRASAVFKVHMLSQGFTGWAK